MPKILIADDSLLIRMMLKAIVSAHRPDWVQVECKNGEEAVQAGEAGGFAVITLDMNMPLMDGMTAAERLRRSNPDAAIALITANVQDSIRQRAGELGLYFINKPIDEAKILAFLSECAHERP
ncbi:MAG: response regulator [Gammaproteobacteria bacterium]|nr:response regulator [Gammaproteobacteria bacterium]